MAPPRILKLTINDVGSGPKKINRTMNFCPTCDPNPKPINVGRINVIVIAGENFAGGTATLEHDLVPIYIVHQLVCPGSPQDRLIVWFVVPNCKTADEEAVEPVVAPIGALTVTVTTTGGDDTDTDPDVEPD